MTKLFTVLLILSLFAILGSCYAMAQEVESDEFAVESEVELMGEALSDEEAMNTIDLLTDAEAFAVTKCATANVNVRSGPGTSYGIQRVLSKGASVSVGETKNGWSSVGSGWVSSQYLGACSGSSPSAPASGNPGFKYDYATACTSGPSVGATKLLNYILKNYGGRSGGIYNCRSVRGASNLSLHGEGRALDVMLNVNNANEKAIGDRIVNWLIGNGAAKAKELGVQEVIFNRKIWSSGHPTSGLRAYSGSNPHIDHVHIGLNRWGAAHLSI